MKHFNVPAIDGIPGIMPGTIQLPPPPEFEDDEPKTPPESKKMSHARKGVIFPKHKRRMMPCDKKDQS